MEQDQPTPPDLEPPWYYQRWFLIPVFILGWPFDFPFVFWPIWGVLIVRSPWHLHTMIKGLGWASLFVGGAMFVMNLDGDKGVGYAVAVIFPGVLATLAIQLMWHRFRLEHGLVIEKPEPPPPPQDVPWDEDAPEEEDESREARLRRRSQRRRSARSDRSSR